MKTWYFIYPNWPHQTIFLFFIDKIINHKTLMINLFRLNIWKSW
ncbi:hypothetical protein POKO110462_18175 [Pontibacter korlensis]